MIETQKRKARIESSPTEYVCQFRSDGVLIYANDAYCAMLGRTRETSLGLNIFRPRDLPAGCLRIHPDDLDLVRELVESLSKDNVVGVIQHRVILGDDSVRWQRWVNMIIIKDGGSEAFYQAVGREITDEQTMQHNIVEAVDRQRQAIGGMMHDTLGQNLAGTSYLLSSVRQDLEPLPGECAAKLDMIAKQVTAAQKQLASIITGLHPVDLSAEELSNALSRLAQDTQEHFGITCRTRTSGVSALPSDTAATHLYHIVQESVTNAIKHASPTQIDISLEQHDGHWLMTIDDDGCGLLPQYNLSSGMGTRIMKHRAAILGGRISIAPRPDGNGGTRVQLTLRF